MSWSARWLADRVQFAPGMDAWVSRVGERRQDVLEAFAARLETAFLQRFGPHLTQADHKWRLDRLLMDDIRWEGERNDRAAVARRRLRLRGRHVRL